jgi:3-isopropylmalate dehydrogenase
VTAAAKVVVLPGDGIGPEVTSAGVAVLERTTRASGVALSFETWPIGGAALRAGLPPLPADTLRAARAADAVLLGAIGDPTFDGLPAPERPEAALLTLRRELGVYANLRPARVWPGLEGSGPLRAGVLAGTDLIVVRELTGGLYYGLPRGIDADGAAAVNTMRYERGEIERIAHVAFQLASTRKHRVVSVDKANVLEVSRLWRSTVSDVGRLYPDVSLTHEYVDAAAMKLVLAPSAVDVLLTENLFGDILSDEAGAVCGSLGLLPSASLGDGPGLYEPVHGSAPGLADRDVANPIGAIASAAMLLTEGLGLPEEGEQILRAIDATLTAGLRTADIASAGVVPTGTRAFTGAVCRHLDVVRRT